MAQLQLSQHFNNEEEMEASMKEFFILMNKQWYLRRIKELAESWPQTLQHDGLSCEFLAASVVTLKLKQISYRNIAKPLIHSHILQLMFTDGTWRYLLLSNCCTHFKCWHRRSNHLPISRDECKQSFKWVAIFFFISIEFKGEVKFHKIFWFVSENL